LKMCQIFSGSGIDKIQKKGRYYLHGFYSLSLASPSTPRTIMVGNWRNTLLLTRSPNTPPELLAWCLDLYLSETEVLTHSLAPSSTHSCLLSAFQSVPAHSLSPRPLRRGHVLVLGLCLCRHRALPFRRLRIRFHHLHGRWRLVCFCSCRSLLC